MWEENKNENDQIKILRSPIDDWMAKKMQIPVEELSQEKLESYQIREIRKMIHMLKEKSRFYRESLADWEPDRIRTMEDFRQLPTVCEADLAGQEWLFQCVDASRVRRVVTVPTTGTTGKSKRICFTEEDLELAQDFAPYGFAVMCDPGDKVLVMMSGGSPGSIGDNIRRGIEPIGMEVKSYGLVEDLESAAQCLLSFQPDVIVGIPLQMMALQRYMDQKAYAFRLKSILLSADDVPEAVCRQLRRGWGCHTFRHYGMTEICMFGALECQGQSGYHLRAADHLFEILHPDEDGFGEIAVTTFHHTGMPLLRYRTGDIGRITTQICACGSPLARIETIRGRKKNCAAFPKGTVFLGDLAEAVFSVPKIIDWECRAGEDTLEILVKTLPGDQADLVALQNQIKKIHALQGVKWSVSSEMLTTYCLDRHAKKKLRFNDEV